MEAAKPGFSLAASLFLLFLAIDHLSNKVGLGFAKFGNKIAFWVEKTKFGSFEVLRFSKKVYMLPVIEPFQSDT